MTTSNPPPLKAHAYGGYTGQEFQGRPVARIGGVECTVHYKDAARVHQVYVSLDTCDQHGRPYYSQLSHTGQLLPWRCNGSKERPCRLS